MLVFPYEKLKERIVTTFNAQQRATKGHQELQIDELSGHWLSGVKMKGVHLFSACLLFREHHQIDYRNVGSRHAHGKAIELALQLRNYKMQRLGRAGGGRNHR